MDIAQVKKIGILGFGQSGISLCNLSLGLRKQVWVSDAKESSEFPQELIKGFAQQGVEFEFGGNLGQFLKDTDLVVLSPGFDQNKCPLVRTAQSLGIPLVGEIEFASWFNQAKIVAITGTNGKTTTTHLSQKVLESKGKKVFAGGNIGTPFSSFVLETKKNDIVVLEVSSFQLETSPSFRPYVAAFLNIEPDHLDRYPDFKDYLQTKMNIFKNQGSEDWAVLNRNLMVYSLLEKKIRARIVDFSDEFPNENFSCVYRIAGIFGLTKTDCLNVFSSFKGLPHRLELVKKVNGITFINDSKATNPSSTVWALENTKNPIILLAGGRDKDLDYSSIKPFLRRVKKINLFGEASAKIKQALDSKVESEIFSSFEGAIKSSFKESTAGDTVLLSPMCASFDMFSSYQERGNKFIETVNNL
jgi:UDP-N-acetylmuramoylalanine--D-glutamate ligase